MQQPTDAATGRRARPSETLAALDAGWRQFDDGSWWRFGTEADALTLHPNDPEIPGFDCEFGIVAASSPREALRIDRETIGSSAESRQ